MDNIAERMPPVGEAMLRSDALAIVLAIAKHGRDGARKLLKVSPHDLDRAIRQTDALQEQHANETRQGRDLPEVAEALRSVPVRRGTETIFIPLPRELWRRADTCCCAYCTSDREKSRPAYWDTLAVSTDSRQRHTWTVHAPEFHGVERKRVHE